MFQLTLVMWVLKAHIHIWSLYKCAALWRSYRDEIESWNREEIPFFLQIVPRCLLFAEGPQRALPNAAHSIRANRLMQMQRRLLLGSIRLRQILSSQCVYLIH